MLKDPVMNGQQTLVVHAMIDEEGTVGFSRAGDAGVAQCLLLALDMDHGKHDVPVSEDLSETGHRTAGPVCRCGERVTDAAPARGYLASAGPLALQSDSNCCRIVLQSRVPP